MVIQARPGKPLPKRADLVFIVKQVCFPSKNNTEPKRSFHKVRR